MPSQREQRGLWYLQALMRYGVGGGGLVWTMLHGLNPLALLVFGTVATSTDVFGFVKALIRQAREETLRLDEELKRESERSPTDRES